ncbi:hypothetical protein D2Q93_06340 [Alicyclobacillaceae bacterium I2511]|nr:hypothetical protein D2Q93_06340 [Alicyclobacillaceae bacterium I2511]
MKQLTRMLLVNWHYIDHQILDFAPISFLTGKNGAGKSTILDALQLVILGDTSGHFFNKAANDNSRRSLRGYLRGEVAEVEERGLVYLRSGQFSSYIVAEFTDTVKKQAFCFGVVFDSSPEGDHQHRFFQLNEPLPQFHFIRDDVPLDIQGLRQWGLQKKNRLEMFESNRRYQEVFLAKMGALNEKFFRLFRKAVPFSPIMDVAGFISEFVVDVKSQVDIDDMRANIRHYRLMEQELKRVQARVESLEQISAKYVELQTVLSRLQVYRYLLDRADLHRLENKRNDLRRQLDSCVLQLEQTRQALSKEEVLANSLREQRDVLLAEKVGSNAYVRLQQLEAEKKLVETQFAGLRQGGVRIDRLWVDHKTRWAAVAEGLKEVCDGIESSSVEEGLGMAEKVVGGLVQSAGTRLGQALKLLQAGLASLPKPALWRQRSLLDEGIPTELDLPQVAAAFSALGGAAAHLRDVHQEVKAALTDWEQKQMDLQRSIAELEQGIKQYNPMVLSLQRSLRAELAQTLQPQVEIFADLLEVRNPEWQAAIEGYLHTQRFHLLLSPELFSTALRIYNQVKRRDHLFDVGLVDIAKILEQKLERWPGSLAEEVETQDPHARAYADYLLGRVMKCESVEDLRNYRTAVTREGMLYQNFVARQMNPKRWETLYLGKRAIAMQLAQQRQRKLEVNALLMTWQPLQQRLSGFAMQDAPGSRDLEDLREFQDSLFGLKHLRETYRQVVDELGHLDLSYLLTLDERIQTCEADLHQVAEDIRQHQQAVGGLEREGQDLEERALPVAEADLMQANERLKAGVEPTFAEKIGEPRYQQELKRLGSIGTLIANFTRQKAAEATRVEQYQRALVQAREAYNRQFQAGFDIQRFDNQSYNQELQGLRDSQMAEYEGKIKAAKERAQVQFQEDFISKLRNNIETVELQIKELNQAIHSVSFGKDRYRFQVRPNSVYQLFYQMITDDMLLEGFGLFSRVFQERYASTIEELFRNIVDVDEDNPAMHSELEQNLHKFTDYRTYLDFDLLVRDEEGRESRLSKVIAKKSGGETQTPFYISVLASFAQVYRVNTPGLDNTLRLLVFDEAYSKMDHQRIRESIRIVRDLGLQVLLSAPTEKIADITPLVDRTLVVTRIQSETRVSIFDPNRQATEMGKGRRF